MQRHKQTVAQEGAPTKDTRCSVSRRLCDASSGAWLSCPHMSSAPCKEHHTLVHACPQRHGFHSFLQLPIQLPTGYQHRESPLLTAFTSCSCMSQVAVALAKGIDVPPGSDAGTAAEGFAAALMQAWGVGEAGCNDGAVLLLSQQPRQVRTCTTCASYRRRSCIPSMLLGVSNQHESCSQCPHALQHMLRAL